MKILKELRIEKGISQAELGKVLGVGQKTVSQYELGDREPDFQTLKKMCDFFDVSSDYILGFEDD